MAFVVGQGGKNSVLTSVAKKWKDFKSTLTRHYILPYINDRERLSQPPETYKFIEKAQWDAFVASRLSKEFQSDQLEETMPGVEIDRSTLWKRARQDKHGNIPDAKVAEKAKLIDDLQKQVSEGKVSVSGSNDVLTMALGPEHPGRVRGVGAGISPRQYFNLPKPQRMSFDDRLKDSLRVLLQEETKKMEAKAREEALRMEARTKQLVEAEREHLLSQLSQFNPNFDPSLLKPKISPCQNQSPKNPMSNKASCSGGDVRSLHLEDDTAKNGEHHEEKVTEAVDYSNIEVPSSLKSLCSYVETTLVPKEQIINFTIEKEVFGADRNTFVLPEDISQIAGMEEIGATVVAVYMRFPIVSEMDKSWMHSDRRSKAYEFGVEAFLNFSVENLLTTTHIRCPCVKCVNLKMFGVGIIRDHLYFNGVDQSYKNWTFHGEPWEATTNASRNVEEDDGHS
ncbi:unnamed protein product [Prunus brigantina]